MPAYNFRCENCGQQFEEHLSFDAEKNGLRCPHCRSRQTRRVFSAPAITFKGSGFYVTDKHKPGPSAKARS